MTSDASAPLSVPGARTTKQRTAVAAILTVSDDFKSAQQIHDALRSNGDSVGLTTVYRTLQALAAAGDVDVLLRGEGETLYRSCSSGHHHHLVCRSCGATQEVTGTSIEAWAHRVAEQHGYTDVSHTIEIFGTCPDCS